MGAVPSNCFAHLLITNSGEAGAWMDGYNLTDSISVADAVKMGEGQAEEYQLDQMMSDETIDGFFK